MAKITKMLTGLNNSNTSYSFQVAAINPIGTGTYSTPATGIVPYTGGFIDAVPIEYLIVAGGGSGANTGSGGGAGGVLTGQMNLFSPNTYNIVIGAGGTILDYGAAPGTNGENTTAFGLTAIGGGGGVTHGGGNGVSGGSGSGGPLHPQNSPLRLGGSGTVGQGNSGGNGFVAWNWGGCSGGGGGAGQAGSDGGNSPGSGKGGNGILWYGNYYGGGGGGGEVNGSYVGAGGLGGGGNAVINSTGQDGVNNTGGGGGGGSYTGSYYNGGSGGSGVVIIRSLVLASSTTGSPIITTEGSYNVYKFTGTGSITF
jgi:hypothetical protein